MLNAHEARGVSRCSVGGVGQISLSSVDITRHYPVMLDPSLAAAARMLCTSPNVRFLLVCSSTLAKYSKDEKHSCMLFLKKEPEYTRVCRRNGSTRKTRELLFPARRNILLITCPEPSQVPK